MGTSEEERLSIEGGRLVGAEEVQTAKGRFPEERRDRQDAEQELNQVRVEKETRLFSSLGTITDRCFTRVSGQGLVCGASVRK